jgi:site-specific DNA-methyltransferase (adenine-specific)
VTTREVLDSKSVCWSAETADCLTFLKSLPDDSVDLTLFSPPYELQRAYDGCVDKKGQDWVDWMVEVFAESGRVTRGLTAAVVEGFTRKFRYSATPYLLVADLHRRGFNLRKPPAFRRVGIPGSGGPDWLRNDYETVVCVTRPGRLPWSDNTACGHPPKYGPGGPPSHRTVSGRRVNELRDDPDLSPKVRRGVDSPDAVVPGSKLHRKHLPDGRVRDQLYTPPELANPGNVLHYTVGKGHMGHPLAHGNEGPFPVGLAEFFVRSFCPPVGVVCDPFLGSGTTCHAAVSTGRRFVGCDVRESQVELTTRRMSDVTPCFPECA